MSCEQPRKTTTVTETTSVQTTIEITTELPTTETTTKQTTTQTTTPPTTTELTTKEITTEPFASERSTVKSYPDCNNNNRNIDLAILVDVSQSITAPDDSNQANWIAVKNFIIGLIKNFNHIGKDGTLISLVTFNDRPRIEFSFSTSMHQREMVKYVENLVHLGGWTNTSGALRLEREEIFSQSGGDRDDTDNVLLLLTDGRPTVGLPVSNGTSLHNLFRHHSAGGRAFMSEIFSNQTRTEASALKSTGAMIVAVGVTDAVDHELLEDIAGENYIQVKHFTDLVRKVNTLIAMSCKQPRKTTTVTKTTTVETTIKPTTEIVTTIKQTTKPTTTEPNEADMDDNMNELIYEVMTTQPITQTTTVQSALSTSEITSEPVTDCNYIDLCILLDNSGSIITPVDQNTQNWEQMKNFTSAVINHFNNISMNGTQISLVTFNDRPKVEFSFNSSLSQSAMINHVNNLQLPRGWTNTSGAFRAVRNQIFTEQTGDRADAKNVIVLLTDGNPTVGLPLRSGMLLEGVDPRDNSSDGKLRHTIFNIQTHNEAVKLYSSGTTILTVGVTNNNTAALLPAYITNGHYVHVDEFSQLIDKVNTIIQMACTTSQRIIAAKTQSTSPTLPLLTATQPTTTVPKPTPVFQSTTLEPTTMPETTSEVTLAATSKSTVATTELQAITFETTTEPTTITAFRGTTEVMYTDNGTSTMTITTSGNRNVTIAHECFHSNSSECDIDLAILLDVSGPTIGLHAKWKWDTIREFTKAVIQYFPNVGINGTQISLITFNQRPKLEFSFNNNLSQMSMSFYVDHLMHHGGWTNTSGALRMVKEQIFADKGFDRPNHPNVVLLVTDSYPTRGLPLHSGKLDENGSQDKSSTEMFKKQLFIHQTSDEAAALKDRGTEIVAVGVTNETSSMLLTDIAGDNYIQIQNFPVLMSHLNSIVKKLCINPVQSCTPPITDITTMPTAKLNISSDCTVDLVLLVDNSKRVDENNGFADVKAFLRNLVIQLYARNSTIRLSIIEFSSKAEIILNLKEYNQDDVLKFINALPKGDGFTATAPALQLALENIFLKKGNKFPGIPDVLLLVTDNQPSISLNGTVITSTEQKHWANREIIDVALRLQNAGVHIVSIGISKSTDMMLLSDISGHNNVFHVPWYSDLNSQLTSIENKICSIKSCSVDLTVVLDASNDISDANWKILKIFLQDLIRELEPIGGPDGANIAIVSYSVNFEIISQLGEDQADKIINKISELSTKTRWTRTGLALEMTRLKIFNGKGNDRPDAQNVLLLIMNGRPSVSLDGSIAVYKSSESIDMFGKELIADEAILEAMDLRLEKVKIIAIGITDAVEHKLLEVIVSKKDTNYIPVKNYSQLNSQISAVKKQICERL